MQYVLTEEEYNNLVKTKEYKFTIAQAELQNLCTTICDTMPVVKYDGEKSPWGCIINNKNWYCDKCPVSEICPKEHKNWSK